MSSPLSRFLFLLFAPVTVPGYVLFLAGANLLGMAYHVVIEATVAPLIRRPISLSRKTTAALALPVLLAAPLATAAHLAIFAIRCAGRALIGFGRWQAGPVSPAPALVFGSVWAAVASWTTLTCLNAALGSAWVGRPVTGREEFVENLTRDRMLKQLPEAMQRRRLAMIEDLGRLREEMDPRWEIVKSYLEDDEVTFRMLTHPVRARLANLPWYFVPGEVSVDGVDHSLLMLGPLLFAWMLLVRWPGTFAVLRAPWLRHAGFVVRTALAAYAIHALVTWAPRTTYHHFEFPGDVPGAWFRILSPAWWAGVDTFTWVRPEWYLFNAGLWMVLAGLGALVWWLGWLVAPIAGWPRYYITYLSVRLLQRKRIAFFSVGAVTLCVAMMIIVISVMGGFVDSIRQRAHGLLGDLVMDGGLQGFPYYDEFIRRIAGLKDEQTGRPLVVQATPLIHSYGILQFPETKKTTAVRIWGIRLAEYVRVNEFGRDLFYARRYGGTSLAPQPQPTYGFDAAGTAALPVELEEGYQRYVAALPEKEREAETRQHRRQPGDPFPGPGVFKGPTSRPGYEGGALHGVIIGRTILFRRTASGEYRRSPDYPRGELCLLTVLPVTRAGDISPEPPPKPAFRYVDDSRTGIHEIDSMNVYVDFDRLQGLLSMGPERRAGGEGMAGGRCSQIQIKLDPYFGEDRERLGAKKRLIWREWEKFRDELPADRYEYAMLREVDIRTWEEMQASYISAIEKEKFLVLIMFGVISVVAVFLILCIFYMIVQEKTRDIGIIKSVGGSAGGVAAVFLAYGGAIGLVGCVLGSMLGMAFVGNINEIQDWLARLNPNWRVWSPETYSFDRIPDVWKWSEVIGIGILAVVSSIIGATFPAIRAGRTWPVESLRYE